MKDEQDYVSKTHMPTYVLKDEKKLDSFTRLQEKIMSINTKLDNVSNALANQHGEDQKLIAEVGIEWLDLLLRKNRDYGSSVFNPPILAPDCLISSAIRVRMSDKIARLNNLFANPKPSIDESIDDTIRDLGAYCLLLLVEKQRNGTTCGRSDQ